MAKKGVTPEQIVKKLRKVELQMHQSAPIAQASSKIGVTEMTY